MLALLALVAAQATEPMKPVRLVIGANGAITTEEYKTLELCEAARSKIIAYNRRRTDEELKRDKSDRLNHMAVTAACIPL